MRSMLEFHKSELKSEENDLWTEARKYNPDVHQYKGRQLSPSPDDTGAVFKDCLNLLHNRGGFRLAYQERGQGEGDDFTKNVAHYALPGPVYVEIYTDDPFHFARQIGILAVGKKDEVKGVQDGIERIILSHHFSKTDFHGCSLGDDIFGWLSKAYK